MGGINQMLTGGGTRTKYGVAKVYAVALYIDSTGGASALKKYAGPKVPKDPKFFQALVDGQFAKTLHLQMHRSVASEAMVTALDEALAKRLPADVVARFRSAFLKALPSDSLAKGDQLYFMCKGGTLSMGFAAGTSAATLRDKGLCGAFFDIYLGKSPVSPTAKDAIATGFAGRGLYQ